MHRAETMKLDPVLNSPRALAAVRDARARAAEDVTIAVVDEDAVVRSGTRRLLQQSAGFRFVAEARRGDEALELIASTAPDVALLDIRLPGLSGVEVLRRLAATSPRTRALVLSASDDPDDVIAALRAGAAGYLLKRASAAMLAEAVRAVHAGTTVLDPILLAGILATRPVSPRASLSPRELEVAALMGQGMSNEAIATRLGISRRTVEKHISHVYMKVEPPWHHPATRRHAVRRATVARVSSRQEQ